MQYIKLKSGEHINRNDWYSPQFFGLYHRPLTLTSWQLDIQDYVYKKIGNITISITRINDDLWIFKSERIYKEVIHIDSVYFNEFEFDDEGYLRVNVVRTSKNMKSI